nr:hypothetical protein [Tanacetum cinerariifolium]
VQQTGNKDAVAGDRFGLDLVTGAGSRQTARQEAAFRAHGHDDRVLHLLGFYQTQNFGTEVFFTVGPAQATTRNVAETQIKVATQDAVFVEDLNVVQCRENRLLQARLHVVQIATAQLAREVEAGLEQSDDTGTRPIRADRGFPGSARRRTAPAGCRRGTACSAAAPCRPTAADRSS